jgi:DNA-binding XRE family transcriptional regulator
MSDLKRYVGKRKEVDSEFSKGFEEGYQSFKIGVLLKQAREASRLTQEQMAEKLHTKKSAISRMQNHAEDMQNILGYQSLKTLRRYWAGGSRYQLR